MSKMHDITALIIATTGLVTAIAGLITAIAAIVWSYRQERKIQREAKEVSEIKKKVNGG